MTTQDRKSSAGGAEYAGGNRPTKHQPGPGANSGSRDELASVRLLTVTQVAQLLVISVRQVWRLEKDGLIPKAVTIGTRTRRWRLTDMQSYLAGR